MADKRFLQRIAGLNLLVQVSSSNVQRDIMQELNDCGGTEYGFCSTTMNISLQSNPEPLPSRMLWMNTQWHGPQSVIRLGSTLESPRERRKPNGKGCKYCNFPIHNHDARLLSAEIKAENIVCCVVAESLLRH